MLICRIPPKDVQNEICYGSDLTMSKSYSKVKTGGHGTLLIDLLCQSFSTGSADLHSHFLMASETLRGGGEPVAAQRLSEMWAVVQRTLPTLEMQRKYLMEYIRKSNTRVAASGLTWQGDVSGGYLGDVSAIV